MMFSLPPKFFCHSMGGACAKQSTNKSRKNMRDKLSFMISSPVPLNLSNQKHKPKEYPPTKHRSQLKQIKCITQIIKNFASTTQIPVFTVTVTVSCYCYCLYCYCYYFLLLAFMHYCTPSIPFLSALRLFQK
jgi:hypothetical protein